MLKKIAVLAAILLAAYILLMLTAGKSTFKVESRIQVDSSPSRVWEILTTVDDWPAWWPGVLRARLPEGWQPGAPLELSLRGNPGEEPARIASFDFPEKMAWTREGMMGSVSRTAFILEPVPGGTGVLLESSIRGPQAVLARVTGRKAFQNYHRSVLENLVTRLNPPAGRDF